jgi:hypothetical protein
LWRGGDGAALLRRGHLDQQQSSPTAGTRRKEQTAAVIEAINRFAEGLDSGG